MRFLCTLVHSITLTAHLSISGKKIESKKSDIYNNNGRKCQQIFLLKLYNVSVNNVDYWVDQLNGTEFKLQMGHLVGATVGGTLDDDDDDDDE